MDRLEFETESTGNEDNESFDNGAISSGFIELSRLEKKEDPPWHDDPHEVHVTVTTVHTDDDDSDTPSIPPSEEPPVDSDDSVLPRTMQASVRLGMTLLFALLVPAALLTVWCAPKQYALVIGAFWLLLILLFMGLVWVVRAVIMNDARARVFHPYLHAVADHLFQEYNDFREDWRHEILLLTDGPAEEEKTTAAAAQTQTQTPTLPAKRRKPKSTVFRAIVQPFLPLFRRRRRRKQREQEEKDSSSYVPPSVMV
jgi:hypothetical protein